MNYRRNNRNQSRNKNRSNYRHQQSRPAMHRGTPRKVSEAEKKFLDGIPIDPDIHLCLEKGNNQLTMRAIDLVCPIGLGQRGLIVAPPGSGKTTILKHLCQSIAKGYPDIKVYCLLIDERPEEVTDFKRSVEAEVFSSSIDQGYEHHIEIADKVMQEAFEHASQGKDVMVIIDSLTRLARVHNASARSGKTMSGGVDARAMEIPRRIFGSARNIENGGSLTIIASILVETESRMDEVIFEEFKGTGNMELVLSREVAQRRCFPAIDVKKSGTRKIEKLFNEDQLKKIDIFNRKLVDLNTVESAHAMLEQLQNHVTNEDLLANIS